MPSRLTMVSGIQQLLTGERADPRAAQALFLVPLVVEFFLHLLPPESFDTDFAYGTAVALVPTLGAVAIARGLLASRWTTWLPVLDIVALGLYRMSDGTAIGVAVAFPAIWLGLQFGRRGVLVTTLTVLVCFVVPTLAKFGFTTAAFSRVAQITLMALICSAAVAMTAEMWKSQVELTRKNAARLEHALTDLIEQRRLTRTIVNGVDVGLVAIDEHGVYDTVNPRHREFMRLAYPQGHAGHAGQAGFVYDEDGVTLLASEQMPTTRAVGGEAFRDVLIWVGEEPSERRALAVSSTPYRRNDGEFAGAVLAYHDITELVQVSRVKDEFVASVSHELRTPLTSIIGYVDIILEDCEDLPADVRGYLVTVQRNARRLHRLVDDLLSTALHSVTKVLDIDRVSVSELLQRSALEAGKAATNAGLTLELDTSQQREELFVHGDSERLAQVFDNLLSNAIKYTPRGGHIVAALTQQDGQAVVCVQDTGRGISPAELGEVFTKFFRSSSVLTDAIPGIGLGLAITKTIVDAHGGEISVSSELGQGTTFEVRLPLPDPRSVPAA
ncbi:MAG: ATP-binding region, ATPase domain protein [Marmoricola sp.]|jgi:two-component system phosphate regulon sensor histidine kinase PhoR|nr:ATP-binding region, ATPase domain protein [Marmoricola sp.]